MKTLEDQISFYTAYHLDARNRATHFVGVPMLMLALLVAFGWLRIDAGAFAVDGAFVFGAVVIAWYFLLDVTLAVAMVVVAGSLLYVAAPISALPMAQSAGWFAALFVGGWIIQLIGHWFEGRRPALADNFFQVFVAPLFLCAEVFFALGWRPALRDAVLKRAREMRTRATADAEIVSA